MSEWEGRVGSVSLKVNALRCAEARDAALDVAGDVFFGTKTVLTEGDKLPADEPHEGDDGPGAWIVTVTRLGHAKPGGSEWESEYFTTSSTLESEQPWEHPDCAQGGVDWDAYAKAVAERRELDKIALAAEQSRRGRLRA